MNVCTIVAKNYVAQARVLAESFRRHHPGGRFTALVLDDPEGYLDAAAEPFEVLRPAEIELPEFEQMAGAYDVLELSTAVKPWLLRRMLRDGDHVVYLDPDIEIFDDCTEVADLAREHGMVLTPHNVAAMPRDGKKPSETDILIAGAYNLGFIGLGRRAATEEFLDWWGERLLTDCVVDTERGYFVDQRWIDLVPGMVPSVHVLRDPGWNVAYWNLATRTVRREGEASWTVNGQPLRFFHFSGYAPDRPEALSKHQDRILLSERPELRELCDRYGAALRAAGYDEARTWPYTYAATTTGIPLTRALRRIYADGLRAGELERSLFEEEGEAEFLELLRRPLGGGADPRITRYMDGVWHEREDVRTGFPSYHGEDADRLVRWFHEDHVGWAPELSERLGFGTPAGVRAAARAEAARHGDPDARPPLAARAWGVNLAGYLTAELGVGEVARQVIGALDTQHVPVLPVGLVAHASRQGHDFRHASGLEGPFGVNLLCVNADQTPAFAAQAGPAFFAGRHTIGWWWWEVSDFPVFWQDSFGYVDELWAGSAFVAATLAAVSPKPVVRMPMPVPLRERVVVDRPTLGLPEGFLFLYAYDYNSVFGRKNPLAAIEAFTRAFAPGEGPQLVLKSINHEGDPLAHERVRLAAADRPDVHLVDRYLSAAEKDKLMAACDCYISLHRSEGFGITIAEAMALGTPAIATGYSGNMDFTLPATAFVVDHALVPIGPGNDPYPVDAEWAQPDVDHAASLMRFVVEHPEEAARRGRAGREFLRRHHAPEVAGAAMARRLELVRRRFEAEEDPTGLAARAHALEVTRRGPRRSGRGRWSAARLARAAMLRAAKPLLGYQREVDEALAHALDRSVASLRADLEVARGLAEATALAEGRRLGARLDAAAARDADLAGRLEQLSARLDALEATHRDAAARASSAGRP